MNLIDNFRVTEAVSFDKLNEVSRITEEIIDSLTPQAIKELESGSEGDVDKLLQNIFTETYLCLYGGMNDREVGKFNHSSTFYLDKLGEQIEEVLTTESLTYFLMNVMPDFELNWHHVEWAESVQTYKYLAMIAARDHGKSLSPDTPIRMFDGSIKTAGEIKVGDKLMGPDSTERIVEQVRTGKDKLYKIKQTKGDDYIVNSRHILTLLNKKKNKIEDVEIKDVLSLSNNQLYETYRGFKVCVEFSEKELKIEPYYLGIWIGDGNSHNTGITNIDNEVVEYLHDYALKLGMKINRATKDSICWLIHNKGNSDGGVKNNYLLNSLREYGFCSNEKVKKFIPKEYLISSRKQRLELLAGLIDSDGNKHGGGFHISTIYRRLGEDIKNLADSLGFKTNLYGGVCFNKQLGRDYEGYTITISGNLFEIPVKIERKKITKEYCESKASNKIPKHTDGLPISLISRIFVEENGFGDYVSITIDKDKRFVLGDGTVTHNSFFFSNAYAAWRLYRYKKTSPRPELSKLGKEGWLFSFSKTQGSRLLTTLKETIEENPILRERLYPGSSDGWAETKIRCKNGTRVIVGSAGESVRGAHPGWIVVDDFLKDNVLYSADQRNKSIDYFHSVVMNMIQPGGQVIVVGTPFHKQDLYGDLKSKQGWHLREYPSIFPDGTILWNKRYSLQTLLEKKETQGTINFSREHLCRPITSDSSIFPFSILEKSLIGTNLYTMVSNIESFPVPLERVGIGVDLAISSNVGADYTVMIVGGIDKEENLWILDVVRLHGASYDQQISQLKVLNMNFRPHIIQIESNGFQAMFSQMANKENLPVVSATTTSKTKNDLKTGLPGLALMFERGKVKIPHGDQRSKDLKDLIFTELSSITYTDRGLQSAGGHDDVAMAMIFCLQALDYRNSGFVPQFM